jgi:uracil-DNA glycosylase family 4
MGQFTTVAPNFNLNNSPICFIGEALGAVEERKRAYFVGPSGSIMEGICKSIGLSFQNQMKLNVFDFHPVDNNIKPYLDLTKKDCETETFKEYKAKLIIDLQSVHSKVLVPLGATALYALTGLRNIGNFRGFFVDSDIPELKGRKILATYHPATRTYTNRFLIKLDLLKVLRYIDKDLPTDNNQYYIRPTYEQVVSYLDYIQSGDFPIGFDIETKNINTNTKPLKFVTCFSIAHSKLQTHVVSMSVPLLHKDPNTNNYTHYFEPNQEVTIVLKLKHILESGRLVIGHNILYDAYVMYELYGIYTKSMVDTMVLMSLLWPDQPKTLHTLTSIFTDYKFYKVDTLGVKQSKQDNDDLWIYNAKDSAVLFPVLLALHKLLTVYDNVATAERQTKTLSPALFTMCRKLLVNVDKLKATEVSYTNMVDTQRTELVDLLGGIQPTETQQLKSYFFNYTFTCSNCGFVGVPKYLEKDICCKCSHPLTKGDITGMPKHKLIVKTVRTIDGVRKVVTLDKKALGLMSETLPIVSKLKAFREAFKLLSTYYRVELVGDKLCTSINVVGTPNGRFSCSKDVFGRGTNWQNMPSSVRSTIIPRPGNLAAEIDLSQAETVVVAYASNAHKLIEAIEQGKDIHKRTASLMYAVDENNPNFLDELRQKGKQANYGLMYGEGPDGFSRIYSLPKQEALFIHTQFFLVYPEIKDWQVKVLEDAKRSGKVVNPYGRVRLIHRAYDDALHKYLLNQHPQSTVADTTDELLYNKVYYNSDRYPGLILSNQVHDAIWLELDMSYPLAVIVNSVETLRQDAREKIMYKSRIYHIDNEIMIGLNYGKYKESNPKGLCKLKRHDLTLEELTAISKEYL